LTSASSVFDGLSPLSFDLIIADPPWDFQTRSDKGHRKSQHRHYDVMGFDDLAALPVSSLGRGDCILMMWACWPSLPKALDVLAAWGFRYVTGGSWHKRTTHGKSGFGTGYVMRSATEPFLIGTLGSPLTARNIRNVIETNDLDQIDALRREHSRKPDEQYDIMDRLSPRALRRLELFARQPWPGWDAWGNQIDKFDETPSARGGRAQSQGE